MKKTMIAVVCLIAAVTFAWNGDDDFNALRSFMDDVVDVYESGSICYRDMYSNTNFSVIYFDKDVISFCEKISCYTGGVHDSTKTLVGSVSLAGAAHGKLSLADIAAGEAEKRQLEELLKMENRKRLIADGRSEEEIIAHIASFGDAKLTENFYYDDRGLHFIYDPYEIDCYAAGTIDLCVQWPKICKK